jgi:hypothetical protein
MLYGSPMQVCTFFGELVDRLQLSLFRISILDYPILSLIIYIRKQHNGLPFQSTVMKDVSSINFEFLEPDLQAQISSAFIQLAPSAHNVPHESNPEGFTSCDNFFQSMDVKTNKETGPTIGEVNRIAPPVTECLVDANLPGGLYERMATTGGSIKMGGTTVIPSAQTRCDG